MQIVRYEKDNTVRYGSLSNGIISEVDGDIFSKCTVSDRTHKLDDVRLLCPCDPRNIYCVGLNYKAHIKELELPTPSLPANFIKPLGSLCQPGESIVIPRIAKRVDYEGELAIVIKDEIKDVSEGEAAKHILGVTALNDITEREMSYDSTQVTYSKSFDTFSSFGPIIDTEKDPAAATIRTYLNGEKVQEGNTSDLLFSAAYIVSYFSQGRTLYPGDVISLGTPYNVQPMKDGDVVEVEIEGLELRLSNPVKDPNA